MEIISLSLDEETLEKIDEIQEEASFNGRSELIRKAVENLHQEVEDNQSLEGELNAVIVVRHPHKKEERIAHISHDFDDVVTTQLHSKLDGQVCLEVFHTNGKAERVINFYNELEGSKHTESVNMLPQN
ncbi:CopG family ribbon-helix-helix protein [Candidatus Nanohalobium constans]|uniref:CopG family transcriptional regulator, nickel-responsive regulator n=1 Tax=Candidatus Nanohalobium constans TaxID=2565781 RepID=A0A5Q0UEY9_9ARCH|nr:CopG family ribbon-helix-helix protein [Candidatus Nanohalobium constans]QGA79921.1 CopG family transcriptional regulator, nickel-responsive regulator [Candidatus Nanohalobium constans]